MFISRKSAPRTFPFVLLGGLLLAACDQAPATPAQAPAAPPVTVAAPLKMTISNWDEFTGRFVAVEKVDVRSRVTGFLDKVHFTDGQKVEKGDLLFEIDKRPFKLALDLARSEVSQAEAQLTLATNELERGRSLVRNKDIPVREVDSREAEKTRAQAALVGARARVDRAKLDLDWCDVRAPISGRISDAKIDVGNLVTGGGSESPILTTIVSMDPIHFVVEGSEADYLKFSRQVAAGQRTSARTSQPPVTVKLADEKDFVHQGRMNFVDNTLDPKSGTIRARAVFENPSWFLTPGVFGRMRLYGGLHEALLVPDESIVSDQARKIVITINNDGKAEMKQVDLGPIVHGLRVINSGITAEDRIVIAGVQRARPGMAVTAQQGRIEPRNP